jgi:hypothetical protein
MLMLLLPRPEQAHERQPHGSHQLLEAQGEDVLRDAVVDGYDPSLSLPPLVSAGPARTANVQDSAVIRIRAVTSKAWRFRLRMPSSSWCNM